MFNQIALKLRNGNFTTIFGFLLVVIIFAGVLISPLPESVTGAAKNGGAVFFVLIAIFLLPVFTSQGLLGELGSLVLTLILFAMPLSWLWQSGFSNGVLIGGLLPWSDARGYLWGAERLLNGANLTPWHMRRPIFTGFLAFIHALTQENLQVTLAILSFITALAVFLAVREVQRTEGPLVAVFIMLVMFLYYRLHISGITLSESLGLVFGSLGIGLLWRGVRNHHMKILWLGILTLSLALITRAGAFFVLPALILWGIWYYRGQSRISIKFLAIAFSAILVGFSLNYALGKMIGGSNGVPFGNFSWTLYGLVKGNKGWTAIFSDFPGVNLSYQEVYKLAWEVFRKNPKGLLIGIFGTYRDYFNPEYMGAFSFLRLNKAANIVMYILSSFGILWCVRNRRKAIYSMALAALAGILLSVPAVPPIDADSMRAYAATIPFTAVFAGLGLTFLLEVKNLRKERTLPEVTFSTRALLPVSVSLIFFSFLGPIGVKFLSDPKDNLASQSCPADSDLITIQVNRGSYINVVGNSTLAETYLPNIRIRDFKEWISGHTGYPELEQALKKIKAGQSVYVSLNHNDQKNIGDYSNLVYLIANTIPDQSNLGIYQYCATLSNSLALQGWRIYYSLSTEEQQSVSKLPVSFMQKYLWWGIVFVVFIIVFESSWKLFGPATIMLLQKTSKKRIILFCLSLIGLIPGILIYLHSSAILPLGWEYKQLDMTESYPIAGYSYQISVGTKWMTQTNTNPSRARLLEDGEQLAIPNANHSKIEEKGRGRYSLWKGYLYLSTSDNSDPRVNGRIYEILWPTQPPLIVAMGVLGLTLVVVILLVLQLKGFYLLLVKNA